MSGCPLSAVDAAFPPVGFFVGSIGWIKGPCGYFATP
jgi:hypothetical protein